jgi:hypothetical protein
MAVVWLIDLFGDYQSTNSKPLPPLSAQIVNPIFPQQSRRTKKKPAGERAESIFLEEDRGDS